MSDFAPRPDAERTAPIATRRQTEPIVRFWLFIMPIGLAAHLVWTLATFRQAGFEPPWFVWGGEVLVIVLAAVASVRETRGRTALVAIEGDRLAVLPFGPLGPRREFRRGDIRSIALEGDRLRLGRLTRDVTVPLASALEPADQVVEAVRRWHADEPVDADEAEAADAIDAGDDTGRIRIAGPGRMYRSMAILAGLSMVVLPLTLQFVLPNADGIGGMAVFFGLPIALITALAVREGWVDKQGLVFVEPDRLLVRDVSSRLRSVPKDRIAELHVERPQQEGMPRLIVRPSSGAMIERAVGPTTATLMDELAAWRSLGWDDFLAFRSPEAAADAERVFRDPDAVPLSPNSVVATAAFGLALAFPAAGLLGLSGLLGPQFQHPFVIVWTAVVGGIVTVGMLSSVQPLPWRPSVAATPDRLAWRSLDRGQGPRSVHRSQIAAVEIGWADGSDRQEVDKSRRVGTQAVLLRCRPVEGQPPVPPTIAIRVGVGGSVKRLHRAIDAWLGRSSAAAADAMADVDAN